MRRWIFPIIGLLAIALLIWFGGPLLGIGDSKPLAGVFSRFMMTVIVFLVWGLAYLYKELKAKKAGQQLADDLAAPGAAVAKSGPTPDAEEVAQLQKNFQSALKILRSTKMKGQHGEQQFHNLPWYIIIGPPGAGKTTALANSGLPFPLAGQFGNQGLRGVGGTRDCDWWFTDDAVLIDTAGRYTTQDSDSAVDNAGWEGFLGLLKKHRKRRPINGVLIAISLADLIQQSEGERQAHAAAIKKRILELKQKLGIDFPIYVLFTKLDLVAGFTEFFDDLWA
jgi:type VI secretion system protein ImpL